MSASRSAAKEEYWQTKVSTASRLEWNAAHAEREIGDENLERFSKRLEEVKAQMREAGIGA